ncbi:MULTISPECIES: flagellar export protein FliJ [Cytobacillus]|uniref:Flagellar FliJ protein n=1 Tax=Cytobacillus stercorigallinarum TaxID=2762240 RepID=A0ABR8QMG4_9BACI|nr:flagellar export protein FliJ [Cytobacillus stercorigallinarum]MBD7936723.1 flagellar biosynthesis chaperone FliJ [Cytobacillus stercorigallinarum]
MSFKYKFEKIMHVKEREKDEALDIYNQATRRFEEAATKLYELLKKKENLDQMQSERLVSGLQVVEMRYQQQFISNLEKTIDHYQKRVMNARTQMYYYQEKLAEKMTEFKKYEVMKNKKKMQYLSEMKRLENIEMDDISIQQFIHKEL